MTPNFNANGIHAGILRGEIEAAVRQFVLQQFPTARSRAIGLHDSLLTGGIVDSLGILEVITFIEKEFQITVTDEEMLSDHFETIASIADLVALKLAGGAATWTS
jgi:acyl carrier protein